MWTILSYVGLGSAGIISTLYLLWSRSNITDQRDKALDRASVSDDTAERALSELKLTQSAFQDQLVRASAELTTTKSQLKQALDALSTPGSIRDALRLSLGVPADAPATSTTPPSKNPA